MVEADANDDPVTKRRCPSSESVPITQKCQTRPHQMTDAARELYKVAYAGTVWLLPSWLYFADVYGELLAKGYLINLDKAHCTGQYTYAYFSSHIFLLEEN